MNELAALLGAPWFWPIATGVAVVELVILLVEWRVRRRVDNTTWVELRRADSTTWTERPLSTREIRRFHDDR